MGIMLISLVTVSLALLQKEDKILLIAISDGDVKTISDHNDRILQSELKNFIKKFLDDYFQYSSTSYEAQISKASDLMSQNLWTQLLPELEKQKNKLKSVDLIQLAEIESIDSVSNLAFEAVLKVSVKTKLETRAFRIRVHLKLAEKKRTETNPWNYEVIEVRDELI